MKALATLALAATVIGCGPASQPAIRPGRPPSFFAENRITEIRYVKAAAYIADPKPVKVLSLDGLAGGRRELLDAADVGSWESCYENDRVCDGMHWVVEFVSGGKVVKRVTGFNAEPPGFKFFLQACGLSVPLGHGGQGSDLD